MTMETTAHRPSKESKAFDSDRATSHPPTASFIRARAARADLSQDDPIPLFLSDPLGAPDPGEYAPIEVRSRIVPRVLAAVLTASTLAILVTLYQSDFRGLFPANAVSWMGIAPEQAMASANTPAMTQSSLKDSDRATNTLASADTQVLPAPSTPSREAIATAYQTALQAQAPTPAPAPVAAPPAPTPPAKTLAKTLDADTLAGLMTRAKSLLRIGDIVAARLLLERAANAQDATAAFLLAQTYDPAVLGTSDARSIAGDATVARDWYQKAAALGSAEARQRLAQLQN
jgi:TPR repeat protein